MAKSVRLYRRRSARNTDLSIKDMTISELFEKFLHFKLTEGLSERTINDYKSHYRYLMTFLEEKDIKANEMKSDLFRDYIGYMLNKLKLSPVTANVRIRTIRSFLRYCHNEGFTPPIHEVFKPVKTPEDTLQSFTSQELKSLIEVIDEESFIGFRDKIIIFTFLDSMVRCSELVNIKREHVDLKEGSIYLEAPITKTRKSRTVPISDKSIRLLTEYLEETEIFSSSYLFVTYEGDQLSDNTVRRNIADYGKLANIVHKRVSPHTFRHTGALFYIMNGGDPFSLQKILGHSDMSMVRKYIQMTDTDIKRQHDSFSPLKRLF